MSSFLLWISKGDFSSSLCLTQRKHTSCDKSRLTPLNTWNILHVTWDHSVKLLRLFLKNLLLVARPYLYMDIVLLKNLLLWSIKDRYYGIRTTPG